MIQVSRYSGKDKQTFPIGASAWALWETQVWKWSRSQATTPTKEKRHLRHKKGFCQEFSSAMSCANKGFAIYGQSLLLPMTGECLVLTPSTWAQLLQLTSQTGRCSEGHTWPAFESKMCLQLQCYNSAISCKAWVPASAFHESMKNTAPVWPFSRIWSFYDSLG